VSFATKQFGAFFIMDIYLVSWKVLGRGHTEETGKCNFRELLSDWVEHVELNGAAQIEETATQLAED
jgi:hypothetical protein